MTGVADGSLYRLIVFSCFVHLTLISIQKTNTSRSLLQLIETEIAIETDLATDTSSLPNAKKAQQPAIPDTVLPQLPKNFAIDEEKETSDLVAGESEKVEAKKDKKADNLLKKEEASRRAAIEKLRKMQNAKKSEAEVSSDLVKLKDKINSAKELKVSSSGAGNYGGLIEKHVRPCYSVPTAYRLPSEVAIVGIVLSAGGALQRVWVETSSGDPVFDSLAVKAVNDCAPLPEPPANFVGQGLSLRFDPATL